MPLLAAASADGDHALSQEELLERFQAADWEYLPLELTRHAVFKIQRLNWRTAQGLPCGIFAQDLAQSAIQKALTGILEADPGGGPTVNRGVRRWNPRKEPELLDYLKSVVDSDVSSLVNRLEHRLNRYDVDVTHAGESPDSRFQDPETSGGATGGDPERLLIRLQTEARDQARTRALMCELARECAEDEDETRLLAAYLALMDDSDGDGGDDDENRLKPAKVASKAGLPEPRARNARRRIERKSRLIQARLRERSKTSSAKEVGRLENVEA